MKQPIIIELSRSEKRKLRIWIKRETDAGLRTRMSIILHLGRGHLASHTAEALHVARSTVYRVADRFRVWGFVGLVDRREDNGPSGVGDTFLLELRRAVSLRPEDYGFARPSWTQELLCQAMAETTRVRVSQTTMSRYLRAIEADRNRRVAALASEENVDGDARRLTKRLAKHAEYPFTFLDYDHVSFENNFAERQIRPVVILRKSSQSNRSEQGAATQASLMGIYQTLKLRALEPTQTVTEALRTYVTTCPSRKIRTRCRTRTYDLTHPTPWLSFHSLPCQESRPRNDSSGIKGQRTRPTPSRPSASIQSTCSCPSRRPLRSA